MAAKHPIVSRIKDLLYLPEESSDHLKEHKFLGKVRHEERTTATTSDRTRPRLKRESSTKVMNSSITAGKSKARPETISADKKYFKNTAFVVNSPVPKEKQVFYLSNSRRKEKI
jgi:hypothetical protein